MWWFIAVKLTFRGVNFTSYGSFAYIGKGAFNMKLKPFLKPIVFAHMALLFAVCFSAPLSYGANEKPESFKQLEVRAKQGDVDAQYELGSMYHKGERVLKDFQKALKWFKKAASGGHPAAQNELGMIYANGEGLITKRYHPLIIKRYHLQAQYWFKKAAKQGNINAQHNLGYMYTEGYTSDAGWVIRRDYRIKRNLRKAFYWYEKAASGGHPLAQYKLGLLYYYGMEGKKLLLLEDFSLAFYWFKKAAKQGHRGAQYEVSGMYDKGEGVEKDPQKALHWRRKAEQSKERCY